MNFDDVSANIQSKMQRLEQQLANLRAARQRVEGDDAAVAVIDRDIGVLMQTREKLLRSRDLVQQVHHIGQQTQQQHRRDRFYQKLSLALIAFSGVTLLALLGVYLFVM